MLLLGQIGHAGKTSDKMKINSMTVSPDPPKKGDTLSIKANFTLGRLLHYSIKLIKEVSAFIGELFV